MMRDILEMVLFAVFAAIVYLVLTYTIGTEMIKRVILERLSLLPYTIIVAIIFAGAYFFVYSMFERPKKKGK